MYMYIYIFCFGFVFDGTKIKYISFKKKNCLYNAFTYVRFWFYTFIFCASYNIVMGRWVIIDDGHGCSNVVTDFVYTNSFTMQKYSLRAALNSGDMFCRYIYVIESRDTCAWKWNVCDIIWTTMVDTGVHFSWYIYIFCCWIFFCIYNDYVA